MATPSKGLANELREAAEADLLFKLCRFYRLT